MVTLTNTVSFLETKISEKYAVDSFSSTLIVIVSVLVQTCGVCNKKCQECKRLHKKIF